MCNYKDNEILKYLIDNGTIDLAVISHEIEMNNNKKYLECHNNRIWQGNDGAYYTHLPDDKRTLLRRVHFEDIEKYLIEYYKDKEDKPTFKEVFYRWISEKLEYNEIGKGTYDRYENDFKRFFAKSELLNTKIEVITSDDLESFIRKTIATKKLSSKAYSGMRTIMMGMFKYAKKKGYTDISISTFFSDLDISKKAFTNKKRSNEEQVFSEDEIPLLVNYLWEHPDIINLGLLLTLYSGIRTAELSALKPADISETSIHICRQEITYKGDSARENIHEIVDYTKTEAGDRKVILPPDAVAVVQKILEINPNGEFLIMRNNRRVWKNTFNDRLYSVCEAVGIPKRSMHKIRKTYATMLIDSGVDESLIMSQLGHSDIATTKRYYYYANKNQEHNIEQIANAVKFAV